MVRKINKGITENATEKICFVISPIGKDGTETYELFKEVLDYIITPAIKNSGYKLKVIRADDIEHSGSFVKDILEKILESFIVIADLTGKNPNVFYELGIRHSLSTRTILISQLLDDIPSDLREYRTIIYDISLKGAKLFEDKFKRYLDEIYTAPDRSDSPVLDRLPSIMQKNTRELEEENMNLKKELESIIKGDFQNEERKSLGIEKSSQPYLGSVKVRTERVTKLLSLEKSYLTNTIISKDRIFSIPSSQGSFHLYSKKEKNFELDLSKKLSPKGINEKVHFIAVHENNWLGETDYEYSKDLADIRVLLDICSTLNDVPLLFTIVTEKDLSKVKSKIFDTFEKLKSFINSSYKSLYQLELWDSEGLLTKEKELGIFIEL
ncbi:hypothetical protein [Desulfosporosinus sp. SB140]|uniref:hypothetical protein n=1 Tax=Desulfosporosinus paludis TaxID=3115649 RepID=UPI00388DE9DB